MARASSIDLLPTDILEQLQELLRDPRVSQLEATRQINALLKQQGHADRVTKSSVNRYSMKMDKVGEKLRQSREVAEMWIGKLGAAPQGKLGQLVNEILRTLAFDVSLAVQAGDINMESAPEVAKMLKNMAIAMERLEKAASENVKREEEIRKNTLDEAANQVESVARAQGLDDETARFWREKFLKGM